MRPLPTASAHASEDRFFLNLKLAGGLRLPLEICSKSGVVTRIRQAPLSTLDSTAPPQEALVPLKEALLRYAAGTWTQHDIWPIAIAPSGGTELQMQVWRILAEVPYGSTLSYSELAQRAGYGHAVRAVAHACAVNPVPLLIPCHRIIAKDGSLGGFAWGLACKQALLTLEQKGAG